MKKNLLLVSLLALCFTGMIYAVKYPGEQSNAEGKGPQQITLRGADLQAAVADSGILSDDDGDCFSAVADGDLSEKGKKKGYNLSTLQGQGYGFICTVIKNTSTKKNLEIVRSYGKSSKQPVKFVIEMGKTKRLYLPVPRVRGRLIVRAEGETVPLWDIYQRKFKNEIGLCAKKGSERTLVLPKDELIQTVALLISRSNISSDWPSNVHEEQKSEGLLDRLSASVSSLPSLPSLRMPTLFSDEGASGSSSSSGLSMLSSEQKGEDD